MSRGTRYALVWVVAVVAAVAAGLTAVTLVGASIRDRGPLGDPVAGVGEPTVDPQPQGDPVRRDITGDFGVFVVECRGVVAYGLETQPARGWEVVSYETGPDDDVDAVFQRSRESIDLEVFCNRGTPTVAEMERDTLPD